VNFVSNQAYKLAVLADAVAGALLTAKLALFQNDITPTPETPLASYTVATFTGYLVKTITWLAPSIADDGEPEVVGTVSEWRPTDSVTPNSVYGLLLESTGAALYQAGRFDNAPLPMASNLDAILPVIRVRMTPSGIAVIVS
jgi:hypothetical protein